MNAIYFFIQTKIGKRLIYDTDESSKDEIDTEVMQELFMPNSRTFQNDIFDISVEQNRYICLPYYFPDSADFSRSR
jgi:hypothetical protein